jgi:coproporphyrinogen III oxidase
LVVVNTIIICLKKMQSIFISKTAWQTQSEFISKYKKQCDTYFWNAHRNEARGIGGLFSIIAKRLKWVWKNWFNFVSKLGIVLKRMFNCRKKKKLPILQNKKNGRNSVVVVMSSSIWFMTKALYLV